MLNTYSQAQTREAEDLPNDAQRQMLEELAQRRLATFSGQVERHSTAERQRWYDTTSDRRIALMQADAGLHWSDDALLRRALGTVRAEVRDQAERKGWDSPLTEAALRQQTSRTLVSAIEAAVERDPERARSLRTRYDQHIEAPDRAALDALLAEAQTRQRAQQASAENLNSTPPDGQAPTLQWQLQQAEAIAEPGVRAGALRTLHATAAAAEARARALAEQVLARVLKDGLTDPSQIPVREWVTLDSERRQAIETRLDHNSTGTEPAPNPALVNDLATQMTEVPSTFARRDLVPSIAHLPLPQWQRFRDLQAGIRRNDPVTEDEIHAIKRGLQLATTTLPANTPDDIATNYRAELIEEIDTSRRINGKSPDDADIADMLKRRVPAEPYVTRTLELAPHHQLEYGQLASSDTTVYGSGAGLLRALMALLGRTQGREVFRQAMRSLPRMGDSDQIDDLAKALELIPADEWPSRINPNGQTVYYDPLRRRYVVRHLYGNGFWVVFDEDGKVIGTFPLGDLDKPIPRTAQPDELEKIWQIPPLVPPTMPPPVYPGPSTNQPQPPLVETFPHEEATPQIIPGRPTDVQSEPQIETHPIPDIEPPTIYESRPREEHHHIPQFLWRPSRNPPYKFSTDAIRFFAKQTVRIPKEEHWDALHAAYNRAAARAMQAYLEKRAKKAGVTVEKFARRMTEEDAADCFRYLMHAILNPPRGRSEKEEQDYQDAKEFLENVSVHVPKKRER